MKLRRAIAATATVAALAAPVPLALLSVSAPTAFADTADPAPPDATPLPSAPDAAPTDDASPTPTAPGSGPESPAPTPTDTPSPGASASTDPAATSEAPPASRTTTPSASVSPTTDIAYEKGPAPEQPGDGDQGTGDQGKGEQGKGEQADDTTHAVPSGGWSPAQCTQFVPDDSLSVDVSGLPSKIVAGSGWHPFTFAVANHSGAAVRHLYVQSFTEYTTGVNEQASLQRDLAQLQYHDPATGLWTDAYQDYYRDATGRHPYTGTFVAQVPELRADHRVDLQLRVRVAAQAPAGTAFALSTAVYAGRGTSCNINGDTYDFTVLKAGSHPGDIDDARPTGEKPTGGDSGTRPQGTTQIVPVTGALADTGTSEAVPVIGVIGACAVLLGTLLVVVSRRRALALAHPAEAADLGEEGPEPTGPATDLPTDGTADPETADAHQDPSRARQEQAVPPEPDDDERPDPADDGPTGDTARPRDAQDARGARDQTAPQDHQAAPQDQAPSEDEAAQTPAQDRAEDPADAADTADTATGGHAPASSRKPNDPQPHSPGAPKGPASPGGATLPKAPEDSAGPSDDA